MYSLLKGIKILDFTSLLPGPFSTKILVDMGASVINVINPNIQDPLRMDKKLENMLHSNKEQLVLDLKADGSVDIIKELIHEYSVVIEPFRPDVMKNLGLDYNSLKIANNSIIYCSLTGYGQSGITSRKAGHDINFIANSGIGSIINGSPQLGAIQLADISGGMYAAIAILSAIYNRLKTGNGSYIDISMTSAVNSLAIFSKGDIDMSILWGNSYYQYYKTKDDRYIAVGSLEDKFFDQLMIGLGLQYIKIDDRFKSTELRELIEKRISERPYSEWQQIFADLDACVDGVITLKEYNDKYGYINSKTWLPIKFS